MPKIFARNYLLWVTCSLGLVACDASNDSGLKNEAAERSKSELTEVTETPYSVWISAKRMNGFELSNLLKQDDNAANILCQQDVNRPKAYSTHFALVSTPNFDRIDAISKYQMDPSLPVVFGETEHIHFPNLGDFLAQRGIAKPIDIRARDAILLTLSKDGRFSGFCDSEQGYIFAMNVATDEGRLQRFSTSCDQDGELVCMSVK